VDPIVDGLANSSLGGQLDNPVLKDQELVRTESRNSFLLAPVFKMDA
jgi:hypothetical protein